MKNVRISMLVALFLMLTSCNTSRSTMSYVAKEITPADALTLANDTIAHLTETLPPAHTILVIDAPKITAKQTDTLTPTMIEQLRKRGYGVMEADKKNGPQNEQGTILRYLATPMDNGVILRLQYQHIEASRFYPRGADGTLLMNTPFATRDMESTNEQ